MGSNYRVGEGMLLVKKIRFNFDRQVSRKPRLACLR
jgi:hypothetical protein